MRSSRIARHAARILGAATVSLLLVGAVGATPAHAAHNIKTSVTVVSGAHNI